MQQLANGSEQQTSSHNTLRSPEVSHQPRSPNLSRPRLGVGLGSPRLGMGLGRLAEGLRSPRLPPRLIQLSSFPEVMPHSHLWLRRCVRASLVQVRWPLTLRGLVWAALFPVNSQTHSSPKLAVASHSMQATISHLTVSARCATLPSLCWYCWHAGLRIASTLVMDCWTCMPCTSNILISDFTG